MANDELIRKRLSDVFEYTKDAEALPGASYWVGDTAGERKVKDDVAAGRVHWRTAHNQAQRGLAKLEEGDAEAADVYAWLAMQSVLAALESRMRPSDWEIFGRPATRRGRPKKS